MDGKVFIPRQSRHLFPLINNMIKVLFPCLYFDPACKQLCFPPRKGINRSKSTIIYHINYSL